MSERKIDLNQLAQRVHKANMKWWQDPVTKEPIERNKGELLMLVITELAEACEGERKDLMDDKLPHRKMAEVEMADSFIRMLDFCAGFKYNIHEYNTYASITKNKGEALLIICSCIANVRFPIGAVGGMEESHIMNVFNYIESYCKWHGYDLMGAFEEKMTYNATRIDHTHEARQLADGKKW